VGDRKRASEKLLEDPAVEAKRARLNPMTTKPTLSDAEMELLRALEEDVRQEESSSHGEKTSLPLPDEEDDDYDESDEE
jgi:hypothetical protein